MTIIPDEIYNVYEADVPDEDIGEDEDILEDLYCKGWMSNPLLLQQGGYPIRSRVRRQQAKGSDTNTHYGNEAFA